MKRCLLLIIVLSGLWYVPLFAQPNEKISIDFLKKESSVRPGQVLTLACFFKNNGTEKSFLQPAIVAPDNWKVIAGTNLIELAPNEKKLAFFTLQPPANYPVGWQTVEIYALGQGTSDTLSTYKTALFVQEIQNIDMLPAGAPEYIAAGETFKATFLLKNMGNTAQQVFIETVNCDVEGPSNIEVAPGESKQFTVYRLTSDESGEVKNYYYTVRALLEGQMQKSYYRSFTTFPTEEQRKDLFFRFPISASATYLTTNQQETASHAYQFQLSGSGSLDVQGRHQLDFLARGPGNNNLSYLGMYDQYYVSYTHKNAELFVGEKSFQFTPLTESSRYGMGVENKIKLNNGLYFGGLFVKPRFYEKIESEFAGYTGFEFNKENTVSAFYVQKKDKLSQEIAQLFSLNTQIKPFKGTGIDMEFSRGYFNAQSDNAVRTYFNSEFWIFQVAGNSFYAGKNYPGYYRNSTFYSANVSAALSKNISLNWYAKKDFRNARLDTFFVTAPFSASMQTALNWKLAPKAQLRLYWREFEREDRLKKGKFHYRTHSFNTRFNHRFKKIDYSVLGEYGKTTNLLVNSEENSQNTFRISGELGYRFNTRYMIRGFGSWSNINSFVSGEQRDLMAGVSMNAQITNSLNASFHLQNAFDIDDYYRNRNLMQLNLGYRFLRHHAINLQGFYTLFRQEVDKPEFTASVNYTYKFGVPLKQIIRAGDLKGRITYADGQPAEGIVLSLRSKKAITDKNGNFGFRTIEPGQHLLFVDRAGFEIDELTDLPVPAKVEIIEDRESTMNFMITKGARLKGRIQPTEENQSINTAAAVSATNIIVELKNEFEQFRITTDKNGEFWFPMVRPGNWVFKIYANSIPDGYTIGQSVFDLELVPGKETVLNVDLNPKKRKIIFKTGTTLTPLGTSNAPQTTSGQETQAQKQQAMSDSLFYSVQVGAFKKRVSPNSRYFTEEGFDFEIEADGFYRYFIGNFATFDAANNERERLATKFRHPFVVKLKSMNNVVNIQPNN